MEHLVAEVPFMLVNGNHEADMSSLHARPAGDRYDSNGNIDSGILTFSSTPVIRAWHART